MAVGLEKKLERRASMLATARGLIAERGYDGVTIRDLAKECRVTVGTLYNRFGSKDRLLAAAVEELFRAQLTNIQQRSGCRGAELILATAHISVDVIEDDARYSRAVIKGMGSLPARSELIQMISGGFHAMYVRALEDMREQGELTDWADVHLIADMIHDAVADSDRRWANSNHDAAWLCRRTRYVVSAILYSVSRGTTRDELEISLNALSSQRAKAAVSGAS